MLDSLTMSPMEKELRIYTRVYCNKDDYEVAMEMVGELVVARDGAALCALGSVNPNEKY
jgi:hypothetical protein